MNRILIVEDELLVAENMSAILTQGGYEVVGAASNEQEALGLFTKTNPQLVIFDVMISGGTDGISVAKQIKANAIVPFIFVTALADSATLERANELRPEAYLIKPFTATQLLTTVNMVFLSYYKENTTGIKEPPSKREREILELLARGQSSKQIAQALNLSEFTIQTHRKNMMHRYKTDSSSGLVAVALRYKWISL